MCYTGLLKRFVPFFLTFAAGLFIASFFVSIALPEGNWRGRRGFIKQENQRLREENQSLRDQLRLERIQNDELRRARLDQNFDFEIPNAVPPPNFEAPDHPPAPPKRPKQPRFE